MLPKEIKAQFLFDRTFKKKRRRIPLRKVSVKSKKKI